MKRNYLMLPAILFLSCSNHDKAIDRVFDNIQFGAVIRTIEMNNGEFDLFDPSSLFDVTIEVQDEQDGGLMESIDVFLTFKDNTKEGSDFSVEEALMTTMLPDEFEPGENGFPRSRLKISFSEALEFTGVSDQSVVCKDQFLIRLVLNLTDGRSFTTGNGSSLIIGFETFFSSPYCYTVNVVEPIENDLFLGTYLYESIVDGPLGPTFIPEGEVEIFQGHSNNVRIVPLKHRLSHPDNELPINYEFSIVCDESVFQKNQISSRGRGACNLSGAPVLMGPDTENAPVNELDDSVFGLWFVEGYLGFDGECGFGTAPSRIRFTRQ